MRIRYVIYTFVFMYLLCFFSFLIFVKNIKNSDDYRDVKAVVILTGDSLRIAKGCETAIKNGIKVVFLSGVNRNSHVHSIKNANALDVTSLDICIGHNARNTNENASEIVSWCNACGIDCVLVVTSDYHIPRTYLEILKRKNGKLYKFYAIKSEYYSIKFFKRCFKEFNGCILSCIKWKFL